MSEIGSESNVAQIAVTETKQEELIPGATKLAAKRGFLRTTMQTYAATLPAGGVSAAVLASVVANPNPVVIWTNIAAALLSPPLAGLVSYFSIMSQGIPQDYAVAAVSEGYTLVEDDETPRHLAD